MDLKSMVDGLLTAAKAATAIIPGTTDDRIVAAGEKLADLIHDLTDSAPDARTESEMQFQRSALAEAVKAKAERTAERFD